MCVFPTRRCEPESRSACNIFSLCMCVCVCVCVLRAFSPFLACWLFSFSFSHFSLFLSFFPSHLFPFSDECLLYLACRPLPQKTTSTRPLSLIETTDLTDPSDFKLICFSLGCANRRKMQQGRHELKTFRDAVLHLSLIHI